MNIPTGYLDALHNHGSLGSAPNAPTKPTPILLDPPLSAGGQGLLGAQPRSVGGPALSVRDQWARVKHRVSWIDSQLHAVELDHAREEGRGEARPLFSSIKAIALCHLMRAALAVLDELSELIPA